MNDYNLKFRDIKRIITDSAIENIKLIDFIAGYFIFVFVLAVSYMIIFLPVIIFRNNNFNYEYNILITIFIISAIYYAILFFRNNSSSKVGELLMNIRRIVLSPLFLFVESLIVYLRFISFYMMIIFFGNLIISASSSLIHKGLLEILLNVAIIIFGVVVVLTLYSVYREEQGKNIKLISEQSYNMCLDEGFTKDDVKELILYLTNKIEKKENIVKWIMTSSFVFLSVIVASSFSFLQEVLLGKLWQDNTNIEEIINQLIQSNMIPSMLSFIFTIMLLVFLYILFFIKLVSRKDDYILQYLYNIVGQYKENIK